MPDHATALEELHEALVSQGGLTATQLATLRKRLRKLGRRDSAAAADWKTRFASLVPGAFTAPEKPRIASKPDTYLPRSWGLDKHSSRRNAAADWDPAPALELESFRARLAAWNPLLEPVEAWFAECRHLGPRDLQVRLGQLTDCLWACRQLATHRRHQTRPLFVQHYDALRGAARHLEKRGRKGMKRALSILGDTESALLGTLVALPSNLAPITLGGDVLTSDEETSGHGLRFLGHAECLARWNALGGSVWVDIGPGDCQSFAALARGRPQTRFIGVDVVAADPELPDNAEYVAMEEGTAARLRERTPTLVPSADTVSLLYPIHKDQDGKLAVAWQVEAAIDVLAAGGSGVLVTEDPVAVRAAVAVLLADPRCDTVEVLDGWWSADQLRDLGVEPYGPTWSELAPSPAEVADLSAGTLSWGLVVFFGRAT